MKKWTSQFVSSIPLIPQFFPWFLPFLLGKLHFFQNGLTAAAVVYYCNVLGAQET